MASNLTELEQLLLLAVRSLGSEAYGASIQQRLREEAGRKVSVGSIHVTMNRLEERGLVRSSLGAPTPTRGGKAKRLYRVEPAGTAALEESRRLFDRLWSAGSMKGESA